MNIQIHKAAVIGSGVMGSGIAAHLANAGIKVLLLDVTPKELTEEEEKSGLSLDDVAVRNRLSIQALNRLKKQKPAPLTSEQNIGLISVGNLHDDLEQLKDVDWIIEAVVENIDVKRSLFERISTHRKDTCILSSNTSGLSIEEMSDGLSEDAKKYFLGTHFFNPPRYLKLLEIIPTNHTLPEVVSFMKEFGENILGKGIVLAKDTPNFIANRIGIYSLMVTIESMNKHDLSVGEVDSITGPLIGRAKSATFRTLDVVGLDTFCYVASNIAAKVHGEEQDIFQVPDFMKEMLQKGLLGSKSKKGFYFKEKTALGSEIFEIDIKTLEYVNRKKLQSPSIEIAKQQKGLKNKLRSLVSGTDQASLFLWDTLKQVLLYSARMYKEIADDIESIDKAMKWGFGWEVGPFEIWNMLGFEKTLERMINDGDELPEWIIEMKNSNQLSFYNNDAVYIDGSYHAIQENERVIQISKLKNEKNVLKKNSGASLVDLDDGVLLLEFHSLNQAIGFDIIQMINHAVDLVENSTYRGIVIGNQSKNFCVGANIGLILMEAQDDNYFEIELVVRQFQDALMRLKYCNKPVVAAPFGLTLGGGTEVCLPVDAIQASIETYMGLVEPGVGLIPGGGGTKELYIRQIERMQRKAKYDLQNAANHVFETIAMAKVATSAHHAQDLGFLRKTDAISFNQDHLIYDAKQKVISLYKSGYQPPIEKKIPVVGEAGYANLTMFAQTMRMGGYISEHDLKIAKKLAYVLAGGLVPYKTEVSERYLLDIEREAFLSLVGEPKTQARMQYMLLKGKPLRN